VQSEVFSVVTAGLTVPAATCSLVEYSIVFPAWKWDLGTFCECVNFVIWSLFS
jgi:hypothetical protein